ncbi:hypothetical protein PCE1_003432 [Barthelona sp. PCE]
MPSHAEKFTSTIQSLSEKYPECFKTDCCICLSPMNIVKKSKADDRVGFLLCHHVINPETNLPDDHVGSVCPCGHMLHETCFNELFKDYLSNRDKREPVPAPHCPLCRKVIAGWMPVDFSLSLQLKGIADAEVFLKPLKLTGVYKGICMQYCNNFIRNGSAELHSFVYDCCHLMFMVAICVQRGLVRMNQPLVALYFCLLLNFLTVVRMTDYADVDGFKYVSDNVTACWPGLPAFYACTSQCRPSFTNVASYINIIPRFFTVKGPFFKAMLIDGWNALYSMLDIFFNIGQCAGRDGVDTMLLSIDSFYNLTLEWFTMPPVAKYENTMDRLNRHWMMSANAFFLIKDLSLIQTVNSHPTCHSLFKAVTTDPRHGLQIIERGKYVKNDEDFDAMVVFFLEYMSEMYEEGIYHNHLGTCGMEVLSTFMMTVFQGSTSCSCAFCPKTTYAKLFPGMCNICYDCYAEYGALFKSEKQTPVPYVDLDIHAVIVSDAVLAASVYFESLIGLWRASNVNSCFDMAFLLSCADCKNYAPKRFATIIEVFSATIEMVLICFNITEFPLKALDLNNLGWMPTRNQAMRFLQALSWLVDFRIQAITTDLFEKEVQQVELLLPRIRYIVPILKKHYLLPFTFFRTNHKSELFTEERLVDRNFIDCLLNSKLDSDLIEIVYNFGVALAANRLNVQMLQGDEGCFFKIVEFLRVMIMNGFKLKEEHTSIVLLYNENALSEAFEIVSKKIEPVIRQENFVSKRTRKQFVEFIKKFNPAPSTVLINFFGINNIYFEDYELPEWVPHF